MAVLLSLIGATATIIFVARACSFIRIGHGCLSSSSRGDGQFVSGSRKGFCQSIFIAGGNVGWALTPLMVIPFIKAYGMDITPVFAVPGILVAILLWFTAPRISAVKKTVPALCCHVSLHPGLNLPRLVLIVACRSLTISGSIAFLPLYLQTQNISIVASGYFLFIMLFSGAIGGVSRRIPVRRTGKKDRDCRSLVLSSAVLSIFFCRAADLQCIYCLILAGAALLASFSVTVVLAQEIISKNAAMASGLTLGFGIGMGGLGVGLIGIIIEHMGLSYGINLLVWLPLAAGLFALTLRKRSMIPALAQNSMAAISSQPANPA